MTWELRKIGGSGRLCLLLLLAVLCSGVLFTLHATGDSGGYTVSGLRHAMAQEDLDGYEERLWQELEQAAYTGTRSEYDALRRELSAADAALARVRQAEEYPSFRAGLAAESRLKLRMGLFEGFAARSLERGAAVYESLADVIPRAAFLGGPEVLLSFHLTDALALLFPLAAGLTLLTHERAAGLVNLTRPTRLGRSRVYGRKLAAAATLSTAGFVLLYGRPPAAHYPLPLQRQPPGCRRLPCICPHGGRNGLEPRLAAHPAGAGLLPLPPRPGLYRHPGQKGRHFLRAGHAGAKR